MVELAIRIILASALMALSGAVGGPSFDLTWQVMALFASYSFLTYQLDRKDLRNPGFAGLIAVADAAVIATLLGSAGWLESFGFVALIPVGLATSRFGANPLSMAPMVAGSLLVSARLLGSGEWTPAILVQALMTLGLGLLFMPRNATVLQADQASELSPELVPASLPHDYLDLRERFRQMKDHAKELERKGKRERLISQLFDVRSTSTESLHSQLAKRIAEITGAEGVTIYTSAQLADAMVVRGFSGTLPEAVRAATISISSTFSDGQIRHKADQALRALRSDSDKQASASVLLKDQGKLVGMLSLSHKAIGHLDEAIQRAEEAAPYVAAMIRNAERDVAIQRRLREMEMLYTVASLCVGSDTPESACQRTVRELWDTLPLDHLSLHLLQNGSERCVAIQGAKSVPFELLNVEGSTGLEAWKSLGAPELAVFNTGEDSRVEKNDALKLRVGSFVLIPLKAGDELVGVLAAATHGSGGLDIPQIETLRLVAMELSQALGRLANGLSNAEGLVTPAEFQAGVARMESGQLVYLEPLRQDELVEKVGKPAFEHAIRTLARKLRPALPTGAMLCRRTEGDFVAFLPSTGPETAEQWANQVCAMAAMTAITTPDGRIKIPLGLKARLAPFGPQNYQISGTKPLQPSISRMIA